MKECFLDERQWILNVDPFSYLFFCCNLIYFKSWFFDGRHWAISVIKWGLNTQFFLCISVLSDFFLFIDTHSKICLSDRTFQNAKVGESFQVEGNCVCKTDTDWFSKCQAVILSNKSHNHNRRRSLSSSCWKEIFKKKNVSSGFLFCSRP